MKTYYPPHEVRDYDKLNAMVETIRLGGTLPPILVCGETCLTGSHRHRAYVVADRNLEEAFGEDGRPWSMDTLESLGWTDFDLQIPIVEVSDVDYRRACLALDVQSDTDAELNLFCAALAAVTSDDEVRYLASNQTHGDDLSPDQHRRAAAIQRLSKRRVVERYNAINA
jgi:ParB-like nuclease domain